MATDPNVQVAIIGVISTTIITAGVIVTAIINNRKERKGAASAGVEAGVEATLDEKDVLQRMLALIAENERKEGTIARLRKKVEELQAEVRRLRALLRKENS